MKIPKFQDDRTDFQRAQTHTVLIGGRDKFMSGWGGAEGCTSWAYWACRPEDADTVERWVKSRGDIVNVKRKPTNFHPSGGVCHVYVVTEGHPSLKQEINQ